MLKTIDCHKLTEAPTAAVPSFFDASAVDDPSSPGTNLKICKAVWNSSLSPCESHNKHTAPGYIITKRANLPGDSASLATDGTLLPLEPESPTDVQTSSISARLKVTSSKPFWWLTENCRKALSMEYVAGLRPPVTLCMCSQATPRIAFLTKTLARVCSCAGS